MSFLRSLYETPTPIDAAWGHHRIFTHHAYKIVREAQFAPIVMAEAQELARWFPICWALDEDDEPVLVAFRSLLAGGQGYPGDASFREDCLPRVLGAYPLVVPSSESLERRQVLADRAISDNPTDIGAPLLTAEGKFTRAALTRAKVAIGVAGALPATAALSRALFDHGMLEPWAVDLDLGHGQRATFDRLLIIATRKLDDPLLHSIIVDGGVDAGLLVATHRLSLFRMSALLTAARRDVQKTREAVAEPLAAVSLP
ncbi:MAG: SapC family protein [Rhizobiales bacterium]|nr:SapC family protein [Hyphomicrobiales bacterium]